LGCARSTARSSSTPAPAALPRGRWIEADIIALQILSFVPEIEAQQAPKHVDLMARAFPVLG